MYEAVLKKLRTHLKLAELLKSTGSQDIVENAPGDYYWGCGQDGTGQNKLGKILVRVRDEISQIVVIRYGQKMVASNGRANARRKIKRYIVGSYMKFIIFSLLISFSIHAGPIKIDPSEVGKFGCDYNNDDYYKRKDVSEDRLIYSQSLMNSVTEREEDLYNFLINNVLSYHYSSVEAVGAPGYFLNKYHFQYKGSKVTVYRSVHEKEQKTIGFCFEGKFNNELVGKFFGVKTIGEIKMVRDGEFYLLDDAFSVVKFVRKDNVTTHIYIYVDYD